MLKKIPNVEKIPNSESQVILSVTDLISVIDFLYL